MALSKDATNELSLIVHLIVLDPICMKRKSSSSEASYIARHCLLSKKAHAGEKAAAWLHA